MRKVTKEDLRIGLEVNWYVHGRKYVIENIKNNTVKFRGFDYFMMDSVLENCYVPKSKVMACIGKSTAGTKHDQEKLKPTLFLKDMPLAIQEILKVLKFGAKKYSEGNWLKVENGIERYRNASLRHALAQEEFDEESGLLHLAHEATSILMLLELRLREKKDAR